MVGVGKGGGRTVLVRHQDLSPSAEDHLGWTGRRMGDVGRKRTIGLRVGSEPFHVNNNP